MCSFLNTSVVIRKKDEKKKKRKGKGREGKEMKGKVLIRNIGLPDHQVQILILNRSRAGCSPLQY